MALLLYLTVIIVMHVNSQTCHFKASVRLYINTLDCQMFVDILKPLPKKLSSHNCIGCLCAVCSFLLLDLVEIVQTCSRIINAPVHKSSFMNPRFTKINMKELELTYP